MYVDPEHANRDKGMRVDPGHANRGSWVLELIERESGRLNALKERINEEHRLCEEAVGAALEHAINAGEGLTQMKARTSYGMWGAWLRENFEGSERTAQAYMRLHRRREEIRNGAADLSIRGALSSLSTPKPKVPERESASAGTTSVVGSPARLEPTKRFLGMVESSAANRSTDGATENSDAADAGDKTALDVYAGHGELPGESVAVRIKRVSDAVFLVEFSNGKSEPVSRGYLLSAGFKKCECCSGFGLVKE